MKLLRVFAVIGTISMSFIILYAMAQSSIFDQGAALLDNPWGIVSLVDLYVGFFLFTLWIFYREATLYQAIIWGVFMMIFGFLTASVYLLVLSFKESNLKGVLLGKHQN